MQLRVDIASVRPPNRGSAAQHNVAHPSSREYILTPCRAWFQDSGAKLETGPEPFPIQDILRTRNQCRSPREVTLGGNPAPQGARLYATIVHPSLVDIWSSVLVKANGEYEIFVGALNQNYNNAPIEFYMDGKKSTTTATYVLEIVDGFMLFRKDLDIGFPVDQAIS